MNREPALLERLRIASPCPVSWETMSGDERVRHCRECGLNVYDISRLTRAEAERLVASTEGRLCARLYRRADGTVLTADCPVGWREVKRRTARAAGAALTALVGLFSSALGQTPASQQKQAAEECRQQLTLRRARIDEQPARQSQPSQSQSSPQTPTPARRPAVPLSGTLVDVTGALVSRAAVTLTDEKTNEQRQAVADDGGRYEFPALPAGTYTLTVESLGYEKLNVAGLEVRAGETLQADATLVMSAGDLILVGIVDSGFRKTEEYDRDKPALRVNGQIIRYDD